MISEQEKLGNGDIRKMKKYMILSSFIYKLVIFLIAPMIYLIGMTIARSSFLKIVGEILLFSSLVFVDLWLDQDLFHGITGKGQMELLKSAFHGLDILKNGLMIDKIRRFIWLFVLIVISQYHGFLSKEEIQIPLICYYFLEALLQYIVLELMVFISRQLDGPMVFFFIAMITFTLSITVQILCIFIYAFHLEYLTILIALVLAGALSVFTQRYMMQRIYDGLYDERRKK